MKSLALHSGPELKSCLVVEQLRAILSEIDDKAIARRMNAWLRMGPSPSQRPDKTL